MLRRIAVTVVGTAVLAVGVVLLIVPGPGILAILLALTIFAYEYEWARQRLNDARELARTAAEKTATNRIALAAAILFGAGAIGIGGILIFTDILPFSSIWTGLSIALAGTLVLGTTAYSVREARLARKAAATRTPQSARTPLSHDHQGSEPQVAHAEKVPLNTHLGCGFEAPSACSLEAPTTSMTLLAY